MQKSQVDDLTDKANKLSIKLDTVSPPESPKETQKKTVKKKTTQKKTSTSSSSTISSSSTLKSTQSARNSLTPLPPVQARQSISSSSTRSISAKQARKETKKIITAVQNFDLNNGSEMYKRILQESPDDVFFEKLHKIIPIIDQDFVPEKNQKKKKSKKAIIKKASMNSSLSEAIRVAEAEADKVSENDELHSFEINYIRSHDIAEYDALVSQDIKQTSDIMLNIQLYREGLYFHDKGLSSREIADEYEGSTSQISKSAISRKINYFKLVNEYPFLIFSSRWTIMSNHEELKQILSVNQSLAEKLKRTTNLISINVSCSEGHIDEITTKSGVDEDFETTPKLDIPVGVDVDEFDKQYDLYMDTEEGDEDN